MRSRAWRAAPVLLLLWSAAASAAAEGALDGFRYTRPVEVPARGWVRLPLDLTTLRHLGPEASALRLFGPAGEAVPFSLGPSTTPATALEIQGGACRPEAGITVCRLAVPVASPIARQLTVELGDAASGAVAYRLYEPRAGSWRALAEGSWQREGGGNRKVIDLPSLALAGGALRLEIAGAVDKPKAIRLSLGLDAPTALFFAAAAGRYQLVYGGEAGAAAPPPTEIAPPAGVDVAWILPGPEETRSLKPLPATAIAPGAPLTRTAFRASWPVSAAGAGAGDLVALALPDAVYSQARPDLGDLRLAVGQRQIPYVRWSPAEPTLVLAKEGLRPQPESDRRQSRIPLLLSDSDLPLTSVALTTPAVFLHRPVAVRYPENTPPGLAARKERLVARQVWDCQPQPPLSCRTLLEVSGPAPHHLTVRFADGDNPPLGTVDLEIWRRSDVLLFAWPQAGAVRLLAGADSLTAPSYDLASLRDVLLARPLLPAELDLSPAGASGAPPRWSRWVLPATIAAAAVALLLLLRRILATG